jgi:ribosomal protein S18 acetylase RimI-like enzyme
MPLPRNTLKPLSDLPEGVFFDYSDGVVLIRNQNTTIGYCRYGPNGDIEYLYVNPLYRRQGYGSRLLSEVKRTLGFIGQPQPPISPLGSKFFKANGIPVDPQSS